MSFFSKHVCSNTSVTNYNETCHWTGWLAWVNAFHYKKLKQDFWRCRGQLSCWISDLQRRAEKWRLRICLHTHKYNSHYWALSRKNCIVYRTYSVQHKPLLRMTTVLAEMTVISLTRLTGINTVNTCQDGSFSDEVNQRNLWPDSLDRLTGLNLYW